MALQLRVMCSPFLAVGFCAILLGSTQVSLAAADLPTQVAETYAGIAYRSYRASLGSAQALQREIAAFVAQPTAAGLTACRQAWLAAREDYSPTEVFRFVGGPIDAEPANREVKLNAWPLDERWVDAEGVGIINDPATYPELTAAKLVELNEQGGEKNIATGYHALEFILWGEDRSATGPGDRPYTDFVTGGTATHQARRRQYLAQVSELLVAHLTEVVAAWDPGVPGNYRATLLAEPATVALKHAFTGGVMLAGDELSGERLAVAYETQDQEEEQSCFSDNTHRDTILNALGIQRLWLGRYQDLTGPGLEALVAATDPARAAAVTRQLAAAVAATEAIPAPFDQAILGANNAPGRVAILTAIQHLETTADELVAAAKAVGIEVEFGANVNNALVGIADLSERLPAIVAAVSAGDRPAAKAAVDATFDRWLRFETAISREAPTHYQAIESAMNAVRNAAVRAKEPKLAQVQAAIDALKAKLAAVVPLLKKA